MPILDVLEFCWEMPYNVGRSLESLKKHEGKSNLGNTENISEYVEIIKRNLRSYVKWDYATSSWFNSVRSELPIYCEALLRRGYNFNDAEAMKKFGLSFCSLWDLQ